ncbi:MAG: endonuclease/exonuclease/phosphatase family protein [Microbacteriaceae bacterium]|nr:endonuclease/exonuclease/phosphatase family protein [Microbacteriaceae bacterium]
MRVLSYNLEKNKAAGELLELIDRHDLDLLCLQEVDAAALPGELGSMHLVDRTTANRLGLAIYHRSDRYTARRTSAFALKKSLHDRIAKPAHERLLATRLVDRATDHELVVASFHASPLTALNSLRRAQIASAHECLSGIGPGLPHLMVGDYNYPLFRRGLGRSVTRTGHDLTFSDGRTYTRYKFLRGHFDFATSMGMAIQSVETLPKGGSDHMPILVTATYGNPVQPDPSPASATAAQ